GAGGFSATPVPLVEGVENMQIEYGLDTNGDGAPDVYTADPGSYGGCAGIGCATNWANVVSIKLHLLVRTIERAPGYSDAKVYTLGRKANGAVNTFPASGTYGDEYRRHVYLTDVRLNNPSGRSSTP